MNQIFDALLPEEYDQLKQAIPLITVLIAGADNKIDTKEVSWAEKVTHIRTYSLPEEYQAYYEEVGDNFTEKLDALVAELPEDVESRQIEISRRLGPLNDILAKLEPRVGAAMYGEFLSFAKHVARASGGILKFFSISAEEKRWVGLPMLQPIEYHEEEE